MHRQIFTGHPYVAPPTGHVSPTSNIVERTNSHAKLIMCDRRKHSMSPDTLNMILILKANKVLWPNETSLQDILDNNATADECYSD